MRAAAHRKCDTGTSVKATFKGSAKAFFELGFCCQLILRAVPFDFARYSWKKKNSESPCQNSRKSCPATGCKIRENRWTEWWARRACRIPRKSAA